MAENNAMSTPMNTTGMGEPARKPSWVRRIFYGILILILILLVVQYINAAKYEALVQVIDDTRVGVNPTGDRLDYGDLPRDKSAVRTVTLESRGGTGAYVIVWTRGDIADLMDVNKNFFTLEPGTTENLELSIYVPNSAEFKYYRGKVTIFQIPKIW